MDQLLNGLRAAAEPTRLRLLALCARSDLTVTELTHILGQSQPRVSRHLKLLCDAGLVERFREGAWAFFRVATAGTASELALALINQIPPEDPLASLDKTRLEAVRHQRAERASDYFRRNATQWDRIRGLHVDDGEVESELKRLLPPSDARDLIDIGTGTGRLLRIYGPHVRLAVGLDLSREMLSIARASLDRAGLRNCVLRHGDMYQLPWAGPEFDAATLHMVLHYAEDPRAVIAEAARVLRHGGRLIAVDFAPHDLERLRTEHAHLRLGISDAEVEAWCGEAGLTSVETVHLAGDPLTVTIWKAERRTDD